MSDSGYQFTIVQLLRQCPELGRLSGPVLIYASEHAALKALIPEVILSEEQRVVGAYPTSLESRSWWVVFDEHWLRVLFTWHHGLRAGIPLATYLEAIRSGSEPDGKEVP